MENAIDWKRKLTSRKLWAAICSLVTNLVLAFGGTQDSAVKITAIIMAGASVIAYIIGEGLVDASDKHTVTVVHTAGTSEKEKPPADEDDEDPEKERQTDG